MISKVCIIYCMISNLIISCQILIDDDVNQNKFKWWDIELVEGFFCIIYQMVFNLTIPYQNLFILFFHIITFQLSHVKIECLYSLEEWTSLHNQTSSNPPRLKKTKINLYKAIPQKCHFVITSVVLFIPYNLQFALSPK